jgi:hypothetical protein
MYFLWIFNNQLSRQRNDNLFAICCALVPENMIVDPLTDLPEQPSTLGYVRYRLLKAI